MKRDLAAAGSRGPRREPMGITMLAIDRFILLIRELRRSERGMALPTAMFAMIASMGLAGAAVVSSVDVQRGAKRDSGSKSAIAAADAGANVATMRLSSYSRTLAKSPCIAEASGTLIASKAVESGPGAGWCPPVSGTVGRGTYTYWVSPAGTKCDGTYSLCIVSVGTVGGVSRRIELTFNESTLQEGGPTSGGGPESGGTIGGSFEGLVGENRIDVTGSADIKVGIGTNGEVFGQNAKAKVCGDIRVGIGKGDPQVQQCSGYGITRGNVSLPPVTNFMPSDIRVNNQNARFTTCSKGLPIGCQSDTLSGTYKNGAPFDGAVLSLNSETLTVSGPDYWLCKLKMNGKSELIMRAGAKVRFFFKTPQECGMSPGENQIELNGGAQISSTAYQTTPGNFDMPGFYLLGAGGVYLGGNNGTNEMIVYGPDATVELKGSATYKGLIAGENLLITGNATVISDAGYELPPELRPPPPPGSGDSGEAVTTARLFTPQTYVECTGVQSSAEAPNSNC
jgi:hypothetical protein